MRATPHKAEPFRVAEGFGPWNSTAADGNNGCFILPRSGVRLCCIVSDKEGWEHVSVSVRDKRGQPIQRCPTWEEMCHVKQTFWEDEEIAMQLHPRRSEYVDTYPWCLHLWAPKDGPGIPEPPIEFV